MSEFNIEVQGGSSVRLPTAGKYCDRDIIVTASSGISKEEQEKSVTITENGTTEILPDEGKTLSKVAVNVEVESGGGGNGTEEIENIIDQSGVLDSTDGTVEDKVEQLIDKAEREKFLHENLRRISFSDNQNLPETITLDCSNLTSLEYLFYECKNNPKTVLLKNTHNIQALARFIQNSSVETLGVLDLSGVTSFSNAFTNASRLVNLEIEPKTIHYTINFNNLTKLSKASKQSIFDGLAIVTTAQTVTFHKEVKLLQSQIDSANAKGWTVAGGAVVSEEEYYA